MASEISLLLAYRPDLDLLTARWLLDGPVPQLQRDYDAVLAAGCAHGTARWLLDVRRRPAVDVALAEWVSASWLPRVAAQAPAGLRMAFLISPLRAEAVRATARLEATVHHLIESPQPYRIQLFGDEGEAVRWLTA